MSVQEKVADLRLKCLELGLPCGGNREDLENRLREKKGAKRKNEDEDDGGGQVPLNALPLALYAKMCTLAVLNGHKSPQDFLLVSKGLYAELKRTPQFWQAIVEGYKGQMDEAFGEEGPWTAPWRVDTTDWSLACDKRKATFAGQHTTDDWRELANALTAAQRIMGCLATPFFKNESWTFRHLGYWEPRMFAFFSPLDLNDSFKAIMPSQNIFDADLNEEGTEFVGFTMEPSVADFAHDLCGDGDDDDDDDDDGDASDNGPGLTKQAAINQFLESKWPNAKVMYGGGNGGNCDNLVDVLYVRRGNALGGVFIYRNW